MSDGAETDPRILWLLRRAFHSIEAEKERRLRSTGVSSAHYALLINIHGSPGLTSAELARRLRVTPQNIAGLVQKLEREGWVERRDHPLHLHVRELHLTELGRSRLDAADRVVAELERSLREHLGSTASGQLERGLARIEQLPG